MQYFTNLLEKLVPTGGVWESFFLGNPVSAWALAGLVFIALIILFKIIQIVVVGQLKRLAEKTKTDIDDTLIKIIQAVRPPFYSFVAFYIALRVLSIASLLQSIIEIVLISWFTWQVIVVIQILIDYIFKKSMGGEDAGTKAALGMLSNITKAILWALGGLFILSNLGVNVNSLIAGLGIGGLAVALALQNILSDLFSSFAIYFDKPFQVGDYIKVGDYKGTVEKIGIKTTRIRARQGEEIIISNKELTDARVHNYKKLKERRTLFTLGVIYETPADKLRKVSKIIEGAFKNVEKVKFERAHLRNFADWAIEFEVSYLVESSKYVDYLDAQQEINFNIKEGLDRENIDIAYPTQTLYIKKS